MDDGAVETPDPVSVLFPELSKRTSLFCFPDCGYSSEPATMNATIWGRWVARLFQQQRRARRPRSGRPALYFEPLEDRVTPTTFIWSGLGGNNNWSNPANWLGNAAPSNPANPDIVFNSATPRLNTTNDISNLNAKSITISASNYALNGNKLLLSGNVTVG